MTSSHASDPIENYPPTDPASRKVIKYLLDNQNGATINEILQHLRTEYSSTKQDLDKEVESILANGTALGFLERKGSVYMNWVAREMRGKRRRRSCSRRRRRKIRRRSCGPQRRRRRHC